MAKEFGIMRSPMKTCSPGCYKICMPCPGTLVTSAGLFLDVGENVCFRGAAVGTALSDPLFKQYIQEFSIRQGVGGSQSGLNLGYVWALLGGFRESGAGEGPNWEAWNSVQ